MIGSKIGTYEVVAKLGEGGMGEVYRARDTVLNRDVAIKILTPGVVGDPERLARFRREAELLAALNHPHIAHVYGVELSDAGPALVMELVEGQTLAARIAGGPLPQEEAVTVARQIADALDCAHERGIVHRDLKPANIVVSEAGVVKILDFGLAKVVAPEPTTASDVADSPTLTARATQLGMILGTAAYMAPEQAKGRPVDRRADIWAFGAVLFEMLSGRRAFGGDDVTEVMASVIKSEPAWDALPAAVDPAVRRLLRRCLEKDPRRRLRDIAEGMLQLEEGVEPSRPALSGGRTLVWSLAAIAIVAIAFATYVITLGRGRGGSDSRAGAPVSDAVHFNVGVPGVALTNVRVSPDGRTLALVGRTTNGPQGIWLKRLNEVHAVPLAVPGFSGTVLWSPDGRELAATTTAGPVVVRVADGLVRSLASESVGGGPLAWGRDGTILVRTGTMRLRAVNAATGERRDLSDTFFLHPLFLPDGRRFLYAGREKDEGLPDGTYVSSLDAPNERRRVTSSVASSLAYADGHLFFVRDSTLLAQRFDLDRAELTGDPKAIADGLNFFKTAGFAQFDAQGDTIAFVSRGPDEAPIWLDRQGTEIGRLDVPGLYGDISISPDGRCVIAIRNDRRTGTGDLWLYDVSSATPMVRRLTNDVFSEQDVIWSPDGRSIAYRWDGQGPPDVYVLDIDGGSPRLVHRTPDVDTPRAWLPGGRLLITGSGPRVVRLDGSLDDSVSKLPPNVLAVSPDGLWATTTSAITGRTEVYVQPLRGPGGPILASRGGGQAPEWAGDSRALYYRTNRSIYVVRLRPGPSLGLEPPEHVFMSSRDIVSYDVTPKGDRLLVVQGPPVDFMPVNVIVNWQAKLR